MSSLNAKLSLQLQKQTKGKNKMNTKEQITLANTDTSQEQNFNQPSCLADNNNTMMAAAKQKSKDVYIDLKFNENGYIGPVSYFINSVAHFRFNTYNNDAHENEQADSYYISFSTPSMNKTITGGLYEGDRLIIGLYNKTSIDFATFLSYGKNYEFKVEADDKTDTAEIIVKIFYSPNKIPATQKVSTSTKSVTVKVGDYRFLKFTDSDRLLTWHSSNPKVATINSSTGQITAYEPGTTNIFVSDGCGAQHTIKLKVIIDNVQVVSEGRGLHKVIFPESGKTWYCVYTDTVFTENPATTVWKRNNMNYYAKVDPESTEPLSGDLKMFSNEELKLLYGIDPLGVANYIHRYADMYGNLTTEDAINFKGKYFELFFGRKPQYFARDIQANWRPIKKPAYDNLQASLSEAELIMGKHKVWDYIAWADLFAGTINLIVDSLSIIFPHAKVLNVLFKIYDSLDAIVTLFTCCATDIFEDILATVSSKALELMYANTTVNWVYQLVDAFSSFESFFKSIDIDNTLYRQRFEYCIHYNKYEIYMNSASGKKYKLNDYKKYIAK